MERNDISTHSHRVNPVAVGDENPVTVDMTNDSANQTGAYHVTWATHNSRISERMIRVGVQLGEPVILTDNMRNCVYFHIREKAVLEGYVIQALNVMPDHVHLILFCRKSEIPRIVGILKGYSARMINLEFERLDPFASRYYDGTISHLWARKYDARFLGSESYLNNSLNYVRLNHIRHGCSPLSVSY